MGVDAPYNNITRNRRDHTDLDLALLREIIGTKTERKGIEFCIPKYTHLRCEPSAARCRSTDIQLVGAGNPGKRPETAQDL